MVSCDCVQFWIAHDQSGGVLSVMPTTDPAKFKQLILQIERDVLAQAHLRMLLTTADTTVADHRQQLRTVKARIKRTTRR